MNPADSLLYVGNTRDDIESTGLNESTSAETERYAVQLDERASQREPTE